MTSRLVVIAHCASDKEVVIAVTDNLAGDMHTLQDGETKELYVYDARAVTVYERTKGD